MEKNETFNMKDVPHFQGVAHLKFLTFAIALILIAGTAKSQSLSIFDVDASNFPTMKAKFYAFDKGGNQITNLAPTDFEIREDGIERKVLNVSCPIPDPPKKVSIAMSIDVSGSMGHSVFGDIPVELGKTTAKEICNLVVMPPSEFALQTCHHQAFIIQDFTTNKDNLLITIKSIQAGGGNDFDEQLSNSLTGLLNIAKLGKNKRVAVIYTDALWYPLTANELQKCKDTISKYNIEFYTVIYSIPEVEPNGIKKSLQELADYSGGFLYDGVTSEQAAKDIGAILLETTQAGDPCEIEWQSGITCSAGITNAELRIINLNIKAKTSYKSVKTSVALIEFSPSFIQFKNIPPGTKKDTTLKITAHNADFNVTNITSSNSAFTINPKNFDLKDGNSIDLTLSFLPIDSSYIFTQFSFENVICTQSFFASGVFFGKKPISKTLKLIKPYGGEEFIAGSDTMITWEGIPPQENVVLEYTIDNGLTWKIISDVANSLEYVWKNIPMPESKLCKVRVKQGSRDQSGTEQFNLKGHTERVLNVSWSPDGSKVATASSDTTAIIWDAHSGIKLFTLSGHKEQVYNVSWSPDGSKVATASDDKTAIIWNALTGTKLFTLIGHTHWITNVCWSPDGSKVATASWDNNAIIWNASTGTKLFTLIGHANYVHNVSWSPDGSKVATASWDKNVIIWKSTTGTKLFTLNGHTDHVLCASWNFDGSKVATSGFDKTAIIWNVLTGSKLLTLSGHTDLIINVSWSPDGSKVATASYDKTAIIWNSLTGDKLFTLSGHFSNLYHISWSPDGSKVATASWDKTAIIWNALTGDKLFTLIGHTSDIYDVSWSPDGSKVATASIDNSAKIWFVDNSGFDIQEDESELFSIVTPKAQAKNIDMGKVIVGKSKDSVFVDFVQNIGSWAFRVDSIYFRGSDASAFSLVSGLPIYELNEKEGKHAEVRFSPIEARQYEAEIVIVTQAETLIQKIRGEGIEEQLSVFSGWLDFGIVEVSESKIIADTILLTNVSGKSITIDDVQIIGPDTEQFKIENGSGSFTLNATESRKLSIKFEPKYGGRTSSQIAFSYNGVGSPAKVNLFGTGIGGSVYVENDSAFVGDTKNIKLYLSGIKPDGLQKISSKYKGIIRFHKNLLGIKDNNFDWKIINDSIYVTIIGNLNNSFLLAEVPVVIGLGHTDLANIEIVEMNLLDDLGYIIEYEFTKENGEIKILGICEEGGSRLINPAKITKLMQISPNPSDGNVNVELNLVEKGNSTLKIYSVSGELIEERIISNQTGNLNIELNTKNYGNGLYFIHLQTPTVNKIKKLIIYR